MNYSFTYVIQYSVVREVRLKELMPELKVIPSDIVLSFGWLSTFIFPDWLFIYLFFFMTSSGFSDFHARSATLKKVLLAR